MFYGMTEKINISDSSHLLLFVQESSDTDYEKAHMFYINVLNCADQKIPKFLDALAKAGNACSIEVISKSWNEKIKNRNQRKG